MVIEQAMLADLPAILELFNGVQTWLIDKGLSDQWGTVPFSEVPQQRARFAAWIEAGIFYVMCDDTAVVGTIVMNPSVPTYAQAACEAHPRRALYIEALATHTAYHGQGVRRQLLAWAESTAAAQGIEWLRPDCWAVNQALRRYYRRAGFTEFAACRVGSWTGALFEKRVQVEASASSRRQGA